MTVNVLFDGGEKDFTDTADEKYYHHVSEGGVLSIVRNEGQEWRIVRQYSPNGWNQVDGHRRAAALGNLLGSEGHITPARTSRYQES
jgi:hypothetical protein